MADAPKRSPKDDSIFFDGAFVSASTKGTTSTIIIEGHAVCLQDVDRILAIRGGSNFIIGAYRVRSVDTEANTWTLDKVCSVDAGAGMSGIADRQHGKWHDQVPEFYHPDVPNNPGRGETQQKVLILLDDLCPEILSSLVERCLKDEFLRLHGTGEFEWASGPDELRWGHVRDAGPTLGNLAPLRRGIEGWANDSPHHRWNLCDNDGAPLDWVADAAIQTLVYWFEKGRLPKKLKWENLDYYCYGTFDSEMFDLERTFDAGSGFLKISPSDEEPEAKKLPDRAQREAKQRYKDIGRDLGLTRIKDVAHLHLEWYVLRSFLGLMPADIDKRERERGRHGGSVGDVSRISHGIRTVADLVGFSRSSFQR